VNKKYELTAESVEHDGHTLYRIKALIDFSAIGEGDIGGWIEKESNLSHIGDCWVSGGAKVYGSAKVYDDAWVHDDAIISGNAWVYDDAIISGNAWVCGCARVCGECWVSGNARVSGNCILKFNDWTWLGDIILDRGVWTDSYIADSKKYILSNTLEQLYIGDVE
jgi:hypothetical protein